MFLRGARSLDFHRDECSEESQQQRDGEGCVINYEHMPMHGTVESTQLSSKAMRNPVQPDDSLVVKEAMNEGNKTPPSFPFTAGTGGSATKFKKKINKKVTLKLKENAQVTMSLVNDILSDPMLGEKRKVS